MATRATTVKLPVLIQYYSKVALFLGKETLYILIKLDENMDAFLLMI